jgi:hypothetical protein
MQGSKKAVGLGVRVFASVQWDCTANLVAVYCIHACTGYWCTKGNSLTSWIEREKSVRDWRRKSVTRKKNFVWKPREDKRRITLLLQTRGGTNDAVRQSGQQCHVSRISSTADTVCKQQIIR